MKEAEMKLVDLRGQVKAALEGMECEIPFSVRQSWPRQAAEGVIVTYEEHDNRSTDCAVVDFVEYQVDIWAFDRETVGRLAEKVNRAMMEIGLKRTYMGAERLENGTYERKTMRFGRNVDKRWMRAVD